MSSAPITGIPSLLNLSKIGLVGADRFSGYDRRDQKWFVPIEETQIPIRARSFVPSPERNSFSATGYSGKSGAARNFRKNAAFSGETCAKRWVKTVICDRVTISSRVEPELGFFKERAVLAVVSSAVHPRTP